MLKDEIEISYLFSEQGRAALYITHSSWRLNKENIINEDQRYVMGHSHLDTGYVPLPSEAFKNSMENLARRKALKRSPNLLRESIDFNPTCRILLTEKSILTKKFLETPPALKEKYFH
jgi:hypothetical protein